jgi:pimeloyl-ACP methyl ester carboxylesterase
MRLHAVELGSGEPIVLLHGLFGAAQNFGAVQKRLAARGGWRVIALDLRNHGESPHDDGMTYRAMAEDVAETLGALGASPATVVGHSMGGKVAMTLAMTRQETVRRLVVVDIAPVAHSPVLREYVAAMRALPLRAGLTRREAEAALADAIPQPGIRAFLLSNLRLHAHPPAWRLNLPAIDAAMPAIEGFPALQGSFAGAVLFLAGERSGYIRPEHHVVIQELFPGARIEQVPGAAHWVHADNPDGFLHLLTGFLDGTA